MRSGELEWYRRLATSLTLPPTVGRAGPLEEALASGEPVRLWQAALELRAWPPEEWEYARWLLTRNRTLPEWARQGALEILSAQDPLPFLGRMLKEADARQVATGALIKIGSPAVSPLLEALRDADAGVRQAAAEALGRIGDPNGLKAVEEARKQGFI